MRRFFIILLLPLFAVADAGAESALSHNSIEGTWLGSFAVSGAQLRIVFHISGHGTGWTATIDSPDQGASGLGVDQVDWTKGVLTLRSSLINAQFSGRLSADGAQLAGTWSQGPFALPLSLSRVNHVDAPVRPQAPKRPFPYAEEEVTFGGKPTGVTLAGTITFPKSGGPHPAVVLIAGSGPVGRDEEVAGHRIFLVLSDYLTRKGFVVLRYDKRGIGRSIGSYGTATTADFSEDARTAFAYLRTRKEVDPSRVGLIGHSEGGLIAPIVAAGDVSVAFIVLISGPGVTGEKILLSQQEAIGCAEGVSESVLAARASILGKAYALTENEKHTVLLQQKLTTLFGQEMARSPAGRAQIRMMLSPWFRYFLTLNPEAALEKVSCPVLAINGALDRQVPAEQNLPAIRAALSIGGNRDVTIEKLPGLNHLLQEAKTGAPTEYGEIEQTISPGALAVIGDWLARHSALDAVKEPAYH